MEFDIADLLEERTGKTSMMRRMEEEMVKVGQRDESVNRDEMAILTEAVRDLKLFFQWEAPRGEPVVEQRALPLHLMDYGDSGPQSTCSYCEDPDHLRERCTDLTRDLNSKQVRLWRKGYYIPGTPNEIEPEVPQDYLWEKFLEARSDPSPQKAKSLMEFIVRNK